MVLITLVAELPLNKRTVGYPLDGDAHEWSATRGLALRTPGASIPEVRLGRACDRKRRTLRRPASV